MADLREEFLDRCRAKNLSPRTMEWYEDRTRRFSDWCLERGILLTRDLTADDLEAFVLSLQAGPYKPQTVRGFAQVAKTITRYGHRKGLIPSDPTRDFEMPKVPKTIIQTFSDEQLEALLGQPDERRWKGLRDRAILLTLLDTMARVSELAGANASSVDKYIGDEVMVVYSKEFGSEDPFVDAVQSARWMAQNDALGFSPHIGVASGSVIVGYAGTPLKYNCSVFGAPVTVAARCAAVKPQREQPYGAAVVFPARDWGDRDLREVIPPQHREGRDGEIVEVPYDWDLSEPREETVKSTTLEIQELIRTGIWLPYPGSGPEHRARASLSELRRAGLYRPDIPV